MIHVVDTHALLWHFEGSATLSAAARRVLAESIDALVIPTIVLAESKFVIARQRTPVSWDDLLAAIAVDRRFLLRDLDLAIVKRLPNALETNDAIICATALEYQDASGEPVPVITRDRQIRSSGLVQTVW